jgi:excisionase family DNA binding protein
MSTRTKRRPKSTPAAAANLSDALRGTSSAASVVIDDRVIELPAELARQLVELLDDVAEGREVTSAPASLPIGTELAAELLGVSRPWLTTLLDRGEIASTRVGSKRRVRLGDLLAYRRADDARRRSGLSWEFLDE